jgi:LuxR family maltose regulon positive regulatory protein
MALMTRDYAGAFAQLAPLAAGAEASAEAVALHLRLALAAAAGQRPASAALHLAEALRGGHRLGLVRTLLDALRLAPEAARALLRTPVDDRLLALYLQRLAAAGAAGRPLTVAPAAAHPAAALLSEREREIAELLAQAMSNKRIAKVLDVSTETVKWHLKNVYAKLGVGGRGSAVARLRDLDRREPADA